MGYNTHTKFHEDWFKHSNVVWVGDNQRSTGIKTSWRYHKPTLIFFLNKERRIKLSHKSKAIPATGPGFL
jgi:hypothetical protein